ncbi:uncharacterized protein N0V89_001575 [Didymosphaeria variabile]|uniref:Mediator complex subunit 15 KIX domain-containing protein n=1 Tax=Didymosphaeria variabile TaxID=1932322 RepID=A0A9W8XXB5_9PLEO|nr:uncharacterized protein N0V89_001575 [Didymosphaeria variabile]KAJ4361006.1 hypothetical protein N0V89_001575 [Didymosphaeria variabile]
MMQGNQQANRQQTIQQLLLKHYRQAQEKAPPGWQQQITAEERGGLALQFFTSYRLLKPDAHENDALRQSLQFETASFMQSQTKEQYNTTLRQKLFTMQSLRQQQLQGLNPNANNPMNAMNQMNAAQMGMMGQNPQNPGQNTPQQGFPNPQLRQQMQASAIPMSQSQSAMGAQGGNMGNPAQAPNNPQPNLQQGQQPSQQQNMIISRLTQRLMDQARPEIRQQFQNEVNNWPEDKKQQLLSRGINPLLFRFRQQAENMLKNGKISRELLVQLQNQAQPNQAGGGMQQGQMANQMNANQRQTSQQFDFNALANQQNEAMRVQDQGQQVVPASNNNSNVGAQMGNFPPGQQQNAAMAQRQAAQAAAFQNANANLQRQAAQAQAEARARQAMQQQNLQQQMGTPNLHGQPGGLNRPLGTPNPNAAMSMLNRPMVPPGQPNPTTPQQRPQAHVPQMTPQSQGQVDQSQISQLMREAQQRAQQAAGVQGQPLTEQMRMQMIPHELDPMVKQQLLKVPEPQFRHILGQYMANARQRGMINGAFPGGQPPNGQPNMMMNPGQNMPMGGMANGLMNGQNMGNMRPGGLGQPMPGAMGGQQMAMGQRPGQLPHQARLLHAQQTLQQNPGIISMTDNRIFPPSALNAQIRQILPPEIKTWAQLKSWTQQNPNLTPGVDSQKLLLLQVLHFQDLMKQSQQNGMAGQRPQQPPNNMGPIAPPAQMTPGSVPNRPPQQQPNMANLGPVQVTPQEIQAWRQRLPPQQANATDEQLRNFIMQQKINVRRQQQATMLNMQNQQRNQGQPQGLMAGQGPQATRPPPAQAQPAQAAPQTKPAGQPAPPAQPNAQANMTKSMKRPNDDGADAGGEVQPPNAAPQAPAMVPSRSQQGVNLTQEQMSKMGPQQQAQMRANLMKAQDASNKQSQGPRLPSQEELSAKLKEPEREKKFKMMIQQEESRLPKAHVQHISPDVRATLQQTIKEKLPHIKKVEQALRIFLISYESPESENLARTVIRARILLLRQLNPADGTLHPELTLTETEFGMNIRHILQFVGKVMSRMASQQAHAKPGQQNQQQPQREAVTPQLNAANLKIVEQQQRQQKAPPAPTASQPPFQLGGASPSGAPKYFEGAKPLTHLSLPEKKRQKMDPNSQTSTPASKQSPRISSSKGNSPELKRQAPPAAQKPTFKCRFSDCEYSMRGFDTQAELDTHVSHIHTKIDDPVQFALEAMAEYVDVDPKTGQPRQDPAVAARGNKPASTAPRAPPQPIKAAHTPGMPQSAATPAGHAAATPMTRVPTQTGIKGSPSTNLLKTPQASIKVATPSTGAPGKPTPASVTKATHKESDVQPKLRPELEEDVQPLVPVSLFDFSYDDIYSVLDTNGPLTTLDLKDEDNSWALRSRPSSPLDTPDSTSKDTPSTRQSDISENDNLQINLDLKDADMPEAWLNMTGDALPLHLMLSQDLEALGVTLPAMESDDMMSFHPDSVMMDLDSIDKAMDSMGGMPGISV